MSNLDRIVTMSLSATTKVPTANGFSTGMVAAAHTHYTDRSRSYDDTDGMVTDGFDIFDPGYLVAQSMFAQGYRPVKVGRRNSAWTQLVDLTPLGGVYTIGTIYTTTVAGSVITRTSAGSSLAAECTAIAVLINALPQLAEDVDEDKVDAYYNNGVLHIKLAKKAPEDPAKKVKTIEIH